MEEVSIGVFGLDQMEKTLILEEICKEGKETLSEKSSRREQRKRMKPKIYTKETLTRRMQFLDVPGWAECPLHMTDRIDLFDGVILLTDILNGEVEYIRRVLEKSSADRVVVIISKIDELFGERPEEIHEVCYSIMSRLDRIFPNKIVFCIGSCAYRIAIFTGRLSEYRREVLLERVCTVHSILNISDMHPKETKKIFWNRKYFEFIDKTTERYKENKNLSAVSDIIIHAEGIPSLYHTILEQAQSICRKKKQKRRTDVLCVEGYDGSTDKLSFIVKKSGIEEEKVILHRECSYRITDTLNCRKEGTMQIVQVEKEEEIIRDLEKQKQTVLHTMRLIVSEISRSEKSRIEKISTMYPGILVKEAYRAEDRNEKSRCTVEVCSVGPYILEYFMEEVFSVINKTAQISHPLYTIGRTPLGKSSFNTEIAGANVKIEIFSNLKEKIVKNSRSEEESEKLEKTEKTESEEGTDVVELEEEDGNHLIIKPGKYPCTDKTICRIVETVRERVQSIKNSPNMLNMVHSTIMAEVVGLQGLKDISEIEFNKWKYRIIEAHATIQILLRTPPKCVPRSSSDLSLNSLISKKTVKSLVHGISKRCNGEVLLYTENPFLSVANVSIRVPGRKYMDLISLISTFFKKFTPYLLETEYMPYRAGINSSENSSLPPEIFLVKKAKNV